KALAATSIAGGFLVFLYEKNWLEAITKKRVRWTDSLILPIITKLLFVSLAKGGFFVYSDSFSTVR
ncbi:hypothetical protein, partial [Streptococcus suis]|uniref:hypothetical protein n=1 Tax=Streptococcus suis TaxID=1307 RepID=UPI0009458105